MKIKLDKPFAETWEGWERWKADAKANHPVRYFITETIPRKWGRFTHRLSNAWWALRHRFDPRHRYNIVRTGLPPGYYDVDDRMFHVCFHLFAEMMPMAIEKWDMEASPHKEIWDEAKVIYQWWTEVRPKRVDPYDESSRLVYREAFKVEQGYDREDQEMFERLTKIRPYLWT